MKNDYPRQRWLDAQERAVFAAYDLAVREERARRCNARYLRRTLWVSGIIVGVIVLLSVVLRLFQYNKRPG